MAAAQTCKAIPGAMNRPCDLPPLCRPADVGKSDQCQLVCGRGSIPKEPQAQKFSTFGCYQGDNDVGVSKPPTMYDYPTNYPNFHWFQNPPPNTTILGKKGCCKKKWHKDFGGQLLPDPIPIPPTVPNRYPYRYTSAKPCMSTRTKKEWEVRRAFLRLMPRSTANQNLEYFDPRDAVQIKGFETTSMTASLQPFFARGRIGAYKAGGTPKATNEPLFIPFVANTEFDRYVINTLHPNWQNDPLYRRKVVYHFNKK